MTPASEQTDVVRKRRFDVRTIDEAVAVLQQLKQEQFKGAVRFDLGCGGIIVSAQTEERTSLSILDR